MAERYAPHVPHLGPFPVSAGIMPLWIIGLARQDRAVKLLLLHPLPLDGSIWSHDLRSLCDECVAPTLFGEGDDLVGLARAALDQVGDGPIVVVGNSIGGSCAIEVARLAPTQVEALVLCGTKAGHRPQPDLRDDALHLLEDHGLAAAWDKYWRPLFGPDVAADVIEQAWQSAASVGAASIAAGIRAFHGRADREDFLKAWHGPVTIVNGEHDINPEHGRHVARRLQRGAFHLVPGVGHYLPLEAPDVLTTITSDIVASLS